MTYADVILPVPLQALFTYAVPEGVTVEAQGDKASILIPEGNRNAEIHVICEVTDNGAIPLSSYRRMVIRF
jgi:primosomal protein N'